EIGPQMVVIGLLPSSSHCRLNELGGKNASSQAKGEWARAGGSTSLQRTSRGGTAAFLPARHPSQGAPWTTCSEKRVRTGKRLRALAHERLPWVPRSPVGGKLHGNTT